MNDLVLHPRPNRRSESHILSSIQLDMQSKGADDTGQRSPQSSNPSPKTRGFIDFRMDPPLQEVDSSLEKTVLEQLQSYSEISRQVMNNHGERIRASLKRLKKKRAATDASEGEEARKSKDVFKPNDFSIDEESPQQESHILNQEEEQPEMVSRMRKFFSSTMSHSEDTLPYRSYEYIKKLQKRRLANSLRWSIMVLVECLFQASLNWFALSSFSSSAMQQTVTALQAGFIAIFAAWLLLSFIRPEAAMARLTVGIGLIPLSLVQFYPKQPSLEGAGAFLACTYILIALGSLYYLQSLFPERPIFVYTYSLSLILPGAFHRMINFQEVTVLKVVLCGWSFTMTVCLLFHFKFIQEDQYYMIRVVNKSRQMVEQLFQTLDTVHGAVVIIDEASGEVTYSNCQFDKLAEHYALAESQEFADPKQAQKRILSQPIFVEIETKQQDDLETPSDRQSPKTSSGKKKLNEIALLDEAALRLKYYRITREDPEALQKYQVSCITEAAQADERYVQFMAKEIISHRGKKHRLVQIIDVSKSLLYDKVSAKSEFISLINATVSHEMMNPLNSILNQNLNLDSILAEQKACMKKIKACLNLHRQIQQPHSGGSSSSSIDANRCEKPLDESLEEYLVEQMEVFRQAKRCQKMQESSSKMLHHQINCMMDYASISSNKFKKNLHIFDVREAISEIVEIMDYQARSMKNEVTVSYRNFESSKGDGENFIISTDRDRLQRVLFNLYTNALKFTQNGIVSITCEKSYDPIQKRNRLEISVQDNGIGINKEDQEKLFKLFGTVSNETNTSGIGLGLFISKQIVNQYGGVIDVISTKGSGSIFYFITTLELENSQVVQESQDHLKRMRKMFQKAEIAPQNECEDTTVFGQKKHATSFDYQSSLKSQLKYLRMTDDKDSPFPQILIVDDQVFNIEAIKIILKLSGIDLATQVESAFNGIQAVEKVKERTGRTMFDIIFMDCNMPFKDGPTATREIRTYIEDKMHLTQGSAYKQPIIVAVTGHTEDRYVQVALESGMDQVLGKPATTKKIQIILYDAKNEFMKTPSSKRRSTNLKINDYNEIRPDDYRVCRSRTNDIMLLSYDSKTNNSDGSPLFYHKGPHWRKRASVDISQAIGQVSQFGENASDRRQLDNSSSQPGSPFHIQLQSMSQVDKLHQTSKNDLGDLYEVIEESKVSSRGSASGATESRALRVPLEEAGDHHRPRRNFTSVSSLRKASRASENPMRTSVSRFNPNALSPTTFNNQGSDSDGELLNIMKDPPQMIERGQQRSLPMKLPYGGFDEMQIMKDTPNFFKERARVPPTQIGDLNSVTAAVRALTRESEARVQTETYSEGNNPNISVLTNPNMGSVLPTTQEVQKTLSNLLQTGTQAAQLKERIDSSEFEFDVE